MNNSKDLIYGIHPLIEAIEAGKSIEKVFIKKGTQLSHLLQLLRDNGINFQYVPVEKLNRITGKNHQGVVAYISPIFYDSIEQIIPSLYESGVTPLILVLDGITDVRNFGAICRSAECAGVNAIVYQEKGSAIINADTVKTSSGAINNIPICKVKDLPKTVKYLSECGLNIVACTEKTQDLMYNVNFLLPTAIIMGAEDTGISIELLKITNNRAAIPLFGKTKSLNVATAASIILYEAIRQRYSK